MKLDKRIIEGKKPLDCFDAENETVKSFIEKKGYFSYTMEGYINLRSTFEGTLDSINPQKERCFLNSEEYRAYPFFLPEEWVTKPEKKYRPYSLSEWIEQHEIGDIIHYRSKSDGTELLHMYLGTRHRPEYKMLTLGDSSYSLECLFEDYEIEVNSEWKPFGVEVEEE